MKFPMVLLLFSCLLLPPGVAEEASQDVYYVRKDIPRFEIPPYEGERYEDLVPYTLDLAEMARLAINGLTGPNDPDAGYEIWFEAWWFRNPPMMRHEWSSGSQAKFLGPMLLMRLITGSDDHIDIERKMIESWLKMIDDRGYYHRPNRPWVVENVWQEATQDSSFEDLPPYSGGSPLRTVYSRVVEAMILYHTRDRNPMWKRELENIVKGIRRGFVDMGDWGYFGSPGEVPTGERLANDYGWTIQALAQYYRWTGDESIKDITKKLINYMRYHAEFFDPEGGYIFDSSFQAERGGAQSHWHANCLIAFFEYARATGDRELMEWVRKSYEWTKGVSSPLLGFIPEMASRSHPNSEGCTISDMVALAVMMSEAGVGDYWDDAERFLRNHFAESQLTRTKGDYLEKMAAKLEETPIAYNESTDRVTERNIGAFAGWPTPNEWAYKRGIQHCCTGNCTRVIYYAWEDILSFKDGTLRLNMLLNRASPWADVYSHIPYVGQVDLKLKEPCRAIFVHVPEWVPADSPELHCHLNGRARDVRWEGRYINVGEGRPGDTVTVTFPIAERKVSEFIADTYYTMTVKGNTVVAIDPPGRNCPLYQREHFRENHTIWHQVERFVSREQIRW